MSSASTVIIGCRWELRWKVVPGHKRHFYLFLIYVVGGDCELECDYAAAQLIPGFETNVFDEINKQDA